MLRDTHRKARAKRKCIRPIRFPGVVKHAAQLGVHRIHLYLVLSGKRESASLTARYRDLIQQEKSK